MNFEHNEYSELNRRREVIEELYGYFEYACTEVISKDCRHYYTVIDDWCDIIIVDTDELKCAVSTLGEEILNSGRSQDTEDYYQEVVNCCIVYYSQFESELDLWWWKSLPDNHQEDLIEECGEGLRRLATRGIVHNSEY